MTTQHMSPDEIAKVDIFQRVCVATNEILRIVEDCIVNTGCSRVTVGSQSGHSRVYSRVSVGSCKNQAFLTIDNIKGLSSKNHNNL